MQKQKKIKIFLGGFINSTNAQNLNCLALAKYLDKSKYEVYTMAFKNGDFNVKPIEGVKIIKARLPYRIFKYWCWLKGVILCDILYLPKEQLVKYIYFWKRLLGKKSFFTVEGVYSGTNYQKLITQLGSNENAVKFYSLYDNVFSITKYMQIYNSENIGIKSNGILYLGIDFNRFVNDTKRKKLTDIIFIGNNMRDKGITDFFMCAESFKDINFHIVGGGGNYDITNETKKRNLPNVTLHGSLSHDKLSEVLKNVQLMFFPSRSEGFPKVTLECAASGVPSIVYDDYGADEWITTGKNGFVVNTLDEAKNVIEDLVANPNKISELSKNAVELGKKFDWKSVIKDWETVIDKLANS